MFHIPLGRWRRLVIEAVCILVAGTVFAAGANWFPVGYANYSAVGSSAIKLTSVPDSGVTLPATAVHAVISWDQDTCILFIDSVSATPEIAGCYAAGRDLTIDYDRALLQRLQLVAEDASAPPRVHVDYFSN